MNALYVTVCIPLFLLVLAGFNHAHGFTTFGKTPTNQQTPPPQPIGMTLVYKFALLLALAICAPAKPCGNHTECWSIPQTSCVAEPRNPSRKSCLCGDNKPPANGECQAKHKGPNHVCANDQECIFGSTCLPIVSGKTGQENQKICKCLEGYVALDAECSSAGHFEVETVVVVLLVALCRTLF